MTYRLVGYSSTRELGRVRVYVEAEAPPSPRSEVYVVNATSPFDFNGQPLGLRRAPSGVAARVRAHLLGQSAPAYFAAVPFEPL